MSFPHFFNPDSWQVSSPSRLKRSTLAMFSKLILDKLLHVRLLWLQVLDTSWERCVPGSFADSFSRADIGKLLFDRLPWFNWSHNHQQGVCFRYEGRHARHSKPPTRYAWYYACWWNGKHDQRSVSYPPTLCELRAKYFRWHTSNSLATTLSAISALDISNWAMLSSRMVCGILITTSSTLDLNFVPQNQSGFAPTFIDSSDLQYGKLRWKHRRQL